MTVLSFLCFRQRRTTLLRLLESCVRLTHLRRRKFRDDRYRYTWDRLLDQTTTVSITGMLGCFVAVTFFRATFFAPRLSLPLARLFLGVAFAAARFAGLFRAGLVGLRALRRAIDFLFLYCWPFLPFSHNPRLPLVASE